MTNHDGDESIATVTLNSGERVVVFEDDKLADLLMWCSTFGHFTIETDEIEDERGPVAIWLGVYTP